MNIALINGSPKAEGSASGALLNDLKGLLPAESCKKEFCFRKSVIAGDEIEDLKCCDVWVIAFPLYVDGVPSHLLSCLKQIEKAGFASLGIHVYTIVNCGFFEGTQNRNALAIIENWCVKAGLTYGMGVGYGGGGALAGNEGIPLGVGPKASLGKVYSVFSEAIASQAAEENIYISVSFPRSLYKAAGDMGWKRKIKANGGKVKDLNRRV